jgi:hypothetical protein
MVLLALLVAVATTSPLDPLEDAVRTRWEGLDPAQGRAARDLRAALDALEAPRETLLDDLGAAGPAARRLDRSWPEFDADLSAAFEGLEAAVTAERDALAAWGGSLVSPEREARLDRGIEVADRRIARAGEATGRPAVARHWRRACAELERTRRALLLVAPAIGPAPFSGVAPDFSLLDANPISPGTGAPVSPRDHLGRVTGWYYTRLG